MNGIAIGQINGPSFGGFTGGADFINHRGNARGIYIQSSHFGTLVCEQFGRGRAHATTGPCDDCYQPFDGPTQLR
jgi:hypothetical protein